MADARLYDPVYRITQVDCSYYQRTRQESGRVGQASSTRGTRGETYLLTFKNLLTALLVQVLDGDGIERTDSSQEEKDLMRRLAAETIVLLKNDNSLLPLQPDKLRKVAIIGGNARAIVLSGGGSAALKPSYFISPYDGIVNGLPPSVDVTYSEGASSTYFRGK